MNGQQLYAEFIRLLFAGAVGCFVLSLPLSKTQSGATLRRWAGVCLVLALLPSFICGVLYGPEGDAVVTDAGSTTSATSSSTSPTSTSEPSTPPARSPIAAFFSRLGCFAAIVIAMFIAYGVLKLRRRFAAKSKPRDPWEAFFNRGGGKRPFTMDPRVRRSRAPFRFAGDDEDEE